MWKRENEGVPTSPGQTPAAPPPRREAEPPAASSRSSEGATGRAVIGAATTVRGELSGEEDLLVEGKVEGKIVLAQNAVTIGAKGRIAAEVQARAILVDGEVEGNLVAEEQIVIRRSGRVRGDATAPRVTIEDGARFKGSIDMEPKRSAKAETTPKPANAATSNAPNAAKKDALPASLAAAVGSNS